MRTMYIVMGQTGEYSDRREWPVLAYATEQAAQDKVLELDAWLRSQGVHMSHPRLVFEEERDALRANAPDPGFDTDTWGHGTRYYVMAVLVAGT